MSCRVDVVRADRTSPARVCAGPGSSGAQGRLGSGSAGAQVVGGERTMQCFTVPGSTWWQFCSVSEGEKTALKSSDAPGEQVTSLIAGALPTEPTMPHVLAGPVWVRVPVRSLSGPPPMVLPVPSTCEPGRLSLKVKAVAR